MEFVWGIWKDNIPELQLNGPWAIIADFDYENPIRKPIFRSYDDLKEILSQAFGIYEDFKRWLLQIKENEK